MQNLPQIFDGHAQFVEPSPEALAGLDADTLARLNGVRIAAANLAKAQQAERDAIAAIDDGVEAVAAAHKYRNDNYPPSTQHDEWVLAFGNSEQRRALAQRRQRK